MYMGAPQINFFSNYIGPPPPDLFRLILYVGPLRSVSSLVIRGPPRLVSSLTIWCPVDFFHFFRVKLSLGGPQMFEFPGGGQLPPLAPPPLWAPMYVDYEDVYGSYIVTALPKWPNSLFGVSR